MATEEELQKQIDELKEEIESLRASLGNAENSRYGDYERRKALRDAMAEQDAAELEHMRRQRDNGQTIDAQREKEIKQRNEIANQQRKSAASAAESARAAEDLGKALVPQVDMWGKSSVSAAKMAGGLKNMVKVLKGGIPAAVKFVGAFTGGIILQAIQLVFDFVEAIVKLAFGLRDAESQFKRTTGAQAKYAKGVTDTFKATRAYGISLEDASKAHESLYRNMTDFTMASNAERQALGDTAAVLSKLGVSTDSYAKGIQSAVKGMGVSIGDADEMMLGMRETATELGVDVGQFTSQFAEMGGTLAKFGKTGPKVFKELSRVSKITGMDMRSLLDMTNKFDTFEGAAEQAGKLNAALGGNMVNAMDMMMETDPAERFKMMRDAIMDTGLSFDEMSYYQKQFYTNSLGLKDVGELAAMMSGDMDALGGGVQKTEEDYAKAREEAERWQDSTDRLKTILMNLVPTLEDKILPAFDKLMKWMQGPGTDMFEKRITPAITSLFDKFEQGIQWLDSAEGQAKIQQILGSIEKAFVWLSDPKNQEWMKETAINIGKAVIAFKILGQVIAPVVTVFGFLGKSIKKIWKGGKWLFGKGDEGVSRATKGFKGLWNWTKKLAEPFKKIPDLLTKASKGFKSVGTFLKGAGVMLGPLAKKIPVIGSLIGGALNAWEKLKEAFQSFKDGDIVGGIGNSFAAIFKFADGFLSGIPGLVVEYILKPLGLVGEDFDSFSLISELMDQFGLLDGLLDSFREFIFNIGDMFNYADLKRMIWDPLVGLFDSMFGWIPDLMNGLLDAFGFSKFGGSLSEKFSSALDGTKEAFNDLISWFGISSPSKWVIDNIGTPIVDGILAPFKDLGSLLIKLAQEAFNLLPDWAQTGISKLAGRASGIASQAASMGSAALDRAGAVVDAATGAAPSGGDTPYQVTINLELDRKVLTREVINIMGGEAKQGVLY